eukprot:14130203-Alexandrium_andersonii.AAC.1
MINLLYLRCWAASALPGGAAAEVPPQGCTVLSKARGPIEAVRHPSPKGLRATHPQPTGLQA